MFKIDILPYIDDTTCICSTVMRVCEHQPSSKACNQTTIAAPKKDIRITFHSTIKKFIQLSSSLPGCNNRHGKTRVGTMAHSNGQLNVEMRSGSEATGRKERSSGHDGFDSSLGDSTTVETSFHVITSDKSCHALDVMERHVVGKDRVQGLFIEKAEHHEFETSAAAY